MADRYEVQYRITRDQRIPTVRTFSTEQDMQEFVNKHRTIAYARSKRNARKKKLRRRGAWVWFIQRII